MKFEDLMVVKIIDNGDDNENNDDDDDDVLGCNNLWIQNKVLKFHRNILFPSSGIKMETLNFCKTLMISTYKFTQHHPVKCHNMFCEQ
jgi:hypothetical protein